MIKHHFIIILIFFIFLVMVLFAQTRSDSLKSALNIASEDSVRAKLLKEIAIENRSDNPDIAVLFYYQAVDLLSSSADSLLYLQEIGTIFKDIGFLYYGQKQFREAVEPFTQALNYVSATGNIEMKFSCTGNLANSYLMLGEYDNALKYYSEAVEIASEMDDKEKQLVNYINIGNVKQKKGNYSEALNDYILALRIAEESDKRQLESVCLNSIGLVHWSMNDLDKALDYLKRSIDIKTELKDKRGLSASYLNLGLIYADKGLFDPAIANYQKSLQLKMELGDKHGASRCYNNLGSALMNKKDYNYAIEYYLKSLELKKEYEDKDGLSLVLANLAQLYVIYADSSKMIDSQRKLSYLRALEYGKESLMIAQELESMSRIDQAASNLIDISRKLGNYRDAFEYASIYMANRDSLYNIEKAQTFTEIEAKYQNEKKQLEIENLEKQAQLDKKEIEVKNAESRQQKILIYSFVIGFFLILVFSVFLYRLFVQKRKANVLLEERNAEINQQKEEITAQRDEIALHRDLILEQKSEIEDSIRYARRIQNAVIPKDDLLSECFKGHFILFMPKDVVSGDFYWYAKVENLIVVVVADCTGHGVPGAFMSMLGISFLNEIVRRKEVTLASQVLFYLREDIVNALQQRALNSADKGSLRMVRDGMDISLCAIDLESKVIQYAGANNPLYIVKNGNQDNSGEFSPLNNSTHSLFEIKPDKMPISIYERMDEFKNHTISVSSGDRIFLFTDGYADQFGGPAGKKFMYRKFRELIFSSSSQDIRDQGQVIRSNISKWMEGDESTPHNEVYSQVDDITVLGIEF